MHLGGRRRRHLTRDKNSMIKNISLEYEIYKSIAQIIEFVKFTNFGH